MLAGGEKEQEKSGGKRIKTMLCVDFENLLTDYIEGVVGPETNRLMGEHAMKCPVCHETLSAVRSAVDACRMSTVPPPSKSLKLVSCRRQCRRRRWDARNLKSVSPITSTASCRHTFITAGNVMQQCAIAALNFPAKS